MNHWAEHFKEVVNCQVDLMLFLLLISPLLHFLLLHQTPFCLMRPVCPLSEEEIRTAISMLRPRKAPGLDGISLEMLGLGRAETIHWLKTISDTIWVLSLSLRTGRVNSSCHMKDSQSICDNCRGIALLSIPDKVFAKAILNRIKPELSCFSVKTSVAFGKGGAALC